MRCKLHLLQRRKQKQFRLTSRCAILGAIMAVIMGLQIFLRLVARVCLEFVERSGDSAQRFVVASEDIWKRDRGKNAYFFSPEKTIIHVRTFLWALWDCLSRSSWPNNRFSLQRCKRRWRTCHSLPESLGLSHQACGIGSPKSRFRMRGQSGRESLCQSKPLWKNREPLVDFLEQVNSSYHLFLFMKVYTKAYETVLTHD